MSSPRDLFKPLLKWIPILTVPVLVCAFATESKNFDERKLQKSYLELNSENPQPFQDWISLIANNQSDSIPNKLNRVNGFFNRRIQFVDDQTAWGKSDYWATPMEVLAKGQGDCEDFAFAKYFSLLALGVPEEQMRITYVKAQIGGPSSSVFQAHMVLTYYATPSAEPLVLDNLITEIRPASRRSDLRPVFNFGGYSYLNGRKLQPSQEPTLGSTLSKWDDLMQRAHAQGFAPIHERSEIKEISAAQRAVMPPHP